MENVNNRQMNMAKDTIILLIAKVLEGIIGVITLSQYTFLFAKNNLGTYNLINVTVNALAMICIQWLSQSTFRYVNDYEQKDKASEFYSTVFYSWLILNIGAVVVSFALYFALTMTGSFSAFLAEFTPRLLFLSLLAFISFNTSQVTFTLLVAKHMTKSILVLTVSSITLKLLLLIALVKLWGGHIEWILIVNIVFDSLVAIISAHRLKIKQYISFKASSFEVFAIFFAFGLPLIGNVITTTLLNNSDKYLIKAFVNEESVAIYTTCYSLISSSFTMIMSAIMRGTYPTIIKVWNMGEQQRAKQLITGTVRIFLIVIIPAVTGIFVVAGPLSKVMFNEGYSDGASVMGFVAIGYMFLGLTEYSNKAWELNANTKIIFRNSLIGGIVNIALNVMFIPILGYKTAAYTTAIGFMVYFMLSKLGSLDFNKWNIPIKTYAKIFGSAAVMGGAVLIIQQFFRESVLSLLFSIIAAVIVYILCLFYSGEIKSEFELLSNYVKAYSAKKKVD